MICYFTRVGDWRVGVAFVPYKRVFSKILEEKIGSKNYGDGLSFIFVEYSLEGEFLSLPNKPIKVLSYSKKERAVTVIVGVPREFGSLADVTKRRFVVDTTRESILLSQKKMIRLGFTKIDFESLLEDINECSEKYLKLPEIKFAYSDGES